MSHENMVDITLPQLVVTSASSSFRLRCLSAAWSDECGDDRPGLVVLSAVGPDTAVKAIRAILYSPDLAAELTLEFADDTPTERLSRATFDGKACAYDAKVAKLSAGAVHLAALARLPGLLPALDDDRLFAELNGPRFTAPLLRSWVGYLKRKMIEDNTIVMCEGHNSGAGLLTVDQAQLDEIISQGVRSGFLRLVA